MKAWWVAFLVACTSEPKPAPMAPPPAAPVAPAVVDHEDVPGEAETRAADVLANEPAEPGPVVSNRRPNADLAEQIAEIREGGKTVAPAGGVPSPMAADSQKPGRISLLDKQAFDTTTLTADLVAAKMTAAYMAGIKRCYRAYLSKDASAKGELVLKLTVNTTGRAVDATAKGVSAEVGACATAQMASWRFPVPKDSAGDPVIAAFQIKLGLVPE